MVKWISLAWIAGAILFPGLVCAQSQEKTPAKELIQYVQDAQKAGLQDAQIQQNAVKAGWGPADVQEAIAFAHGGPPPKPGTVAAADNNIAAKPADTETVSVAAGASAMPKTTAEKPADPPATAAAEGGGANVKPPLTAAAEPTGNIKPAVINRGVPDEYRIGEGDVIQVNVWGEPSASVGGVVVRPDGKITMPLIKDISVASLTPTEAEKVITERLSGQIKAADVTVIVNQINSKKVFMVGAVKKEGPINYTYRMTIMQALSEAGGLTDYAKRKKIYVLRNENGRQYQLHFDYDAVLRGEHMELNIPLEPGDTLVIPH